MKKKMGIKTETFKGKVAKPKAWKSTTRREEYTVYFHGKITVEAESETIATEMAYDTLNQDGNIQFSITDTEKL
jgi:hypothetical protein